MEDKQLILLSSHKIITKSELQLLAERLSLFLNSLDFNKVLINKFLGFIYEVGLTEIYEDEELFLDIVLNKKSKKNLIQFKIHTIRAEDYLIRAKSVFQKLARLKFDNKNTPFISVFINIEKTDFYPDNKFINRCKLMLIKQSVNDAIIELKQKNDSLNEKLKHLKAENEQLIASLDSNTINVAYLSHEIRTPLNGILGFTEILLKEKLNKKLVSYLRKIKSSGNDLLKISNDILDFTKIESNKLVVENVSFNLLWTIEELKDLFTEQANSKGLEFSINLNLNGYFQLIGDSLHLKQILWNLISNAIKFTQDGSIKIKVDYIKKSDSQIYFLFEVVDTGIGITETAIEKLFLPFTQADNSISRKFGGTGLGLFICKNLVEKMGGEISVISIPEKGTTFSILLPFRIDTRKVDTNLKLDFKNKTALIVDSNQNNNHVIGEVLLRLGFICYSEFFGEFAYERIKKINEEQIKLDLIVIDYNMPFGINGGQLAEKIRTGYFYNPIIIVINAYAYEEGLTGYRKYIDAHLIKPVSEIIFIETIQRLFSDKLQLSNSKLPIRNALEQRKLLAGTKILLAEDNTINQEVVKELLSGLGVILQITDNGKTAFEIAGREKLDLILMDVNMPEMNGFESAIAIKTDTINSSTPIVAMIANLEDKERYKYAGIEDFMIKPFKPDDLFGKLFQWVLNDGNIQQVDYNNIETNQQVAEPSVPFEYNLYGINFREGLQRVDGKQEVYIKLLTHFRITFQDIAKRIKSALNKNDIIEVRYLVHSIKGAGGTIGANYLYQLASDFEYQLKMNIDYKITKELFFTELEKILFSLNKISSEEQPENSNEVTNEENNALFSDLNKLWDALNTDIGIALKLMTNIRIVHKNRKFQSTISELNNLIDSFKIEDAKNLLNKLINNLTQNLQVKNGNKR